MTGAVEWLLLSGAFIAAVCTWTYVVYLLVSL